MCLTREKTDALVTVAEFLPWAEAQTDGRFELFRGEIVAMAPERARHSLTKLRAARALEDAVREANLSCTVFPDGMTVVIDEHCCYEPDAVVQCDHEVKLDEVTVDHPLIVVEVLSPSTAHLDASGKMVDYFRVEGIVHYLIIDTQRRTLIHHRRTGEAIVTRLLVGGRVRLDPPGLDIRVGDLFIDEEQTETEGDPAGGR